MSGTERRNGAGSAAASLSHGKAAPRQSVAALALLAVTFTAVVFLVTDLVFSRAVAVPVAATILTLTAATWFALPLLRRASDDDASDHVG